LPKWYQPKVKEETRRKNPSQKQKELTSEEQFFLEGSLAVLEIERERERDI
jgi:hypothetical protein